MEVYRCRDWSHGTLWLAWSRVSHPALVAGLWGAGLALVLGLVLVSGGGRRRAGEPLPGRGVLLLPDLCLLAGLLLAASVALGPWMGAFRAAGRPSVLLISIDTLRGDRLLGAEDARSMPRLRALADQGTAFTQAMAAAPWTLPSHASLFTSMLPFDHGAQWTHTPLPRRRSMLAERFQDAGYRTAAFTGGSYVSAEFGFDQGFDRYEDHDEAKEGGSHAVFGNAAGWIESSETPFFAFVHTFEAHYPYLPGDGVALPRGRLGAGFTLGDLEAIYRGELRLTAQERAYVEALYDRGVTSVDAHVGDFLAELEEDGALDDTIVVLVSDHGEDLWDHVDQRSPGHGHSLYEELLHVPLVFRAPGRIASGRRVATPVSLLDVAPTLLELCGMDPDPGHRGRSLTGALEEGTLLAPVPLMAESIGYGPDRFAWREGSLKAVLTPYPDRVHMDVHLDVRPVEVFDLTLDPLERDPESGRHHPRVGAAMDILLERSRRAGGRGEKGLRRALPEDLYEQLRSLGYVR